MSKKINTENFIEKAKLKFKDKFNYDGCVYVNAKTKLEIVCQEHGSFFVLPSEHAKSDTGGCSKCIDDKVDLNDPLFESAKIIIHDHKYCQLVTKNITIFNSIKKFLSYKEAGVEYSPAYRNGWNGINYLIDKNGYFYGGLLDKVKSFCIENEIVFSEEDKRKQIINNKSLDLSDKLLKYNLLPRDYQLSIVNTCVSNNKGIVRACTGSGKSLATALITAKINKPTIIYVIGLDLLKQFHDLFSSLFDEPIGFIGNGICDIRRINIASIWTIGSALKIDKKSILKDDLDEKSEKQLGQDQNKQIINMLQKTSLHLFDESHVVTTDTIKKIYKTINPEYIYGFSGTPFRDDNTDLLINGILGEKIIDVSASELIERKILAQPLIKFVTVPKLYTRSNDYQSIYKEYITENEVRNNLIVSSTISLLNKNYIPLVLFKQIKHGQALLKKMEENNVKCAMLYGNDSLDRRTEVKNMLMNKEISVILASTIFDLGVDLPILNALVLGGGGKSSIRALQRIGRVIRSFPGKKFAAIIDFFDQIKFLKKHSMTRYNIYSSEKGFKVFPSKEMF